MENITIKPIAYIKTDFPEKFGIPRQGGIVSELEGRIIFEKEFADANAIREIEKFSHLWLIWGFSENDGKWQPTVRPPRLGGNTRVGVFASRSPFRPNPLGLSVVRLVGVENNDLLVKGADMVDGTPIYDIKPYLPYVDIVNDATDGFALAQKEGVLQVDIGEEELKKVPEQKVTALIQVLAQDPRPQYIEDSDREYGMSFAGFEIRFKVEKEKLKVINIEGKVN